jgi:hypothetical protein
LERVRVWKKEAAPLEASGGATGAGVEACVAHVWASIGGSGGGAAW